mgnify:CR=1 FL=1
MKHFKQKEKRKHSIKRQMIAVFAGMVICLLAILLVVNVKFLEPYYIRDKEMQFIHVYEELQNAVKKGTISNDEVQDELHVLCEKSNISYIVLDMDNEKLITNVHDTNMLKQQLAGYLLNQAQKGGKVLDSTDNYQLMRSQDPWNQSEYIEMWGQLDDNVNFLIRSPVESIRESVALSNRFLIYVGMGTLIICMGLVWYFSRRITKPIQELAELSDRMANLDFEAKYTSGGKNEIGELGDNFNRMSQKLEKAISELKQANNSLQQDIEQKEKMEQMRTEFMGNVSHELKTPIALIQGYAEGLKEGVNDDPESREFYCDVIMDEASKMNQMVKNLLTLNQLEFGNDEVEFARFDIAALVRGVIASCDILIQQAGASVDFVSEEKVYVWGDEFKTEQVVRNYLTNAIHHVDNEKRIEVRIVSSDGKVRVSVFNSGKPIPEEDVPKLWDKFYKVDKAHTREYGGNGIGLSIVKAIMESFHQGYGVRNFDNGVEFWFELDAKS